MTVWDVLLNALYVAVPWTALVGGLIALATLPDWGK